MKSSEKFMKREGQLGDGFYDLCSDVNDLGDGEPSPRVRDFCRGHPSGSGCFIHSDHHNLPVIACMHGVGYFYVDDQHVQIQKRYNEYKSHPRLPPSRQLYYKGTKERQRFRKRGKNHFQ